MSRLLESTRVAVETSRSIVSFEHAFGPTDPEHGRYLRLVDRRAYYLGTGCDTCPLLFERLGGANQSVSAAALSDMLRTGLDNLDSSVIGALPDVVPAGDYVVGLLELQPELVIPGAARDYFHSEQVALWGIDSFWGLAHHPKTPYYRCLQFELGPSEQLFEFAVPLYPHTWLKAETVSGYSDRLRSGHRSTAVAISVLDVRAPFTESSSDCARHWCLVHYLLDGHHKMYAASVVGRPITLVSALAAGESIASSEQVDRVLEVLSTPTAA